MFQQRWKCRCCKKVATLFSDSVIPHFLSSFAVITSALASRLAGATWESAAAQCTADGQVDPTAVKRWQRRFQLIDGCLIEKQPDGHTN